MGLFSRRKSKPNVNVENASYRSNGTYHAGPDTPVASELTMSIPIDPNVDPVGYLKSINAVRERSRLVHAKAKSNRLAHFTVDWDKFSETAAYVVSIVKRDYAPDYAAIPPHGRWQHFEVGGRPRIDELLDSWPASVDALNRTRRLIDLFVVSVLLDAGAGAKWQYKSIQSGKIYRRSEGIAVASLEMFTAGSFSSDGNERCRVDGSKLSGFTAEMLQSGLQVSAENPMNGFEGRLGLLRRLGDALYNEKYFGYDARPGNLMEYLMNHPSTQMTSVPVIPLPALWSVLMDGLGPIWPSSRTAIDGTSLGDAWPCSSMPSAPPAQRWETIVPFHKLTQWLTYSLMLPMSKLMKVRFTGTELMTGLPEYRNGGLLIDTGLLTLRPQDLKRGVAAYHENAKITGQPNVEVVPAFNADDDVVVEWRAVTIGVLDDLLVEVNKQLGLNGANGLSLAQMLEAGTWKGGRELAEVSRPNTKEPPIMTLSDGTVF
ncbi:MAG: hypothetical protein M1833_001823 [Piccolia ochrophora]|nr:MAG: hypothetical protein M1833_001823 [Piccolia ochrophora]